MRRLLGVAATLLAIGTSACSGSGCTGGPGEGRQLGEATDFLVHDVAVFDADQGALVPHQDVEVRRGQIAAVRPTGDPLPAGLQRIDGTGRTLLPGFIDAHTHLGSPVAPPGKLVTPDPPKNLAAWHRAGVTTVMDMGGLVAANRALAEKPDLAAPRIFSAPKPITVRGGHPLVVAQDLLPWPVSGMAKGFVIQVDGPDDAAKAIDQATDGDPDYIKIICDELPPGAPQLDAPTLTALVAEAHARDLRAVVHIGDEEDALAAVRAGADLLAHGVWRGGLSDAGLAELAASGIPVIPTLYGFMATQQLGAGTWQPTELDRALGWGDASDAIAGPAGLEFRTYDALSSFVDSIDADMPAVTRRMHDAGVPILVGTDAPLPAVWPGSGFHRELLALQDAGIPAPQVLLGATARPADWLGRDLGRITRGAPADLVLVEGDPTTDVAAAGDIVEVWRMGRRIEE